MLSDVLRDELRGRKVLATDLDGTLLRPDLSVGELTRDAIAAAIAAGIHVVFVTGRPPRWMRAVARETGHRGTAICANGAVLLDLAAEVVLDRTILDAEATRDVAGQLRARYGSAVLFAVERVQVAAMPTTDTPFGQGSREEFALEEGYRGRLPLLNSAPRLPLDELLALPDAVKLLARLAGGEASTFLPTAVEAAAGRLEVTHSADDALMEFGPRGVTKASALADLVAGLGLTPDDVVAVGDMPNDVAMLDWAGIGLAVADGHASAKAVASHHVPNPIDDGVGRVLRAMLGQG